MKLFRKKYITGTDNTVYLVRWNILSTKWFSVKVHKFLRSDQDCMHDHPWSFLSFIIRGGYVEQTPEGFRLYGSGSLLFRKATHRHRLIIYQPCWTVVLNFRVVRAWGFWTNHGWVFWKKYFTSSNSKCD